MNWNNQDGNGPFGGFPFGGFPFGTGGSQRREQRPSFPKVSLPFSRRTLFLLALLLIVAVGLPMIASFLADYYWYEAEHLTSVFWTRLLPQWALLGVFSAVAFVIVYPNLRAALRIARGIPGANDALSLILNHK